MILFFAGTETYKSFIESEILQFQGLLNLNRCAVLYSKQVSSYFAMTVIVLHKKSFLPHYFENIKTKLDLDQAFLYECWIIHRHLY